MKTGIRLGGTACPETVAGFLTGWEARTLAFLLLPMPAMGQAEDYHYTTNNGAIIITGTCIPSAQGTRLEQLRLLIQSNIDL